MSRTYQPRTLRSLTERLGRQIAMAALTMKDEPDKFPETLDALKVLTTLQSVLARTQSEPDGGGIDEFTKLFGGQDSLLTASRSAGDTGDGDEDDDDPEFDPTETTGLGTGVSGDLDGVVGPAPDAALDPERDRARVDSD